MARRFQVMKKTEQGLFRATCQTAEELEAMISQSQQDPQTKWIVVKDRHLNRRHLVWLRSQGTRIEPWWLDD